MKVQAPGYSQRNCSHTLIQPYNHTTVNETELMSSQFSHPTKAMKLDAPF